LIKEVGARPLTHSLYEMAKRLAQLRAVELPEEALGVQSRFKEHYIQARYPDARLGPYERWKAEECLRRMEML